MTANICNSLKQWPAVKAYHQYNGVVNVISIRCKQKRDTQRNVHKQISQENEIKYQLVNILFMKRNMLNSMAAKKWLFKQLEARRVNEKYLRKPS